MTNLMMNDKINVRYDICKRLMNNEINIIDICERLLNDK